MDAVSELKSVKYFILGKQNLHAQNPNKEKWARGDCPKCNSVFCVVRYKKKKFCTECGIWS